MEAGEFVAAYENTRPGFHLVYFIGCLAKAATQDHRVAKIASAARFYAETCGDHLVQKRLGEDRYEYRLVKRQDPQVPMPTTPALRKLLQEGPKPHE